MRKLILLVCFSAFACSGAWLLTERALSPVMQMAASNRFQGLLLAAQDPAPAGKWAAGS